ncbi:MAG: hypothetical protein AAF531_01995 [Actinomycetota bacterium]
MTTLYYDPLLDVHHRLPVASAMTTSYYAAPQAPEDARRLFEGACRSMRLDGEPELPLRATRSYASALVLAREWGLTDLEDRLVAAIEASYEPTWDTERGEFTWGLGLNEPHPRGQYNAFLAAAEAAGPGRWTRLSEAPLERCPQVVDVDFPNVALTRAEWVGEALHVTLAPLVENPRATTTFRFENREARLFSLTGIEGATMEVRANHTVVRVPMVHGDLEFTHGSY